MYNMYVYLLCFYTYTSHSMLRGKSTGHAWNVSASVLAETMWRHLIYFLHCEHLIFAVPSSLPETARFFAWDH